MKVSSPKQYIPAVENSSDVVHHFTEFMTEPVKEIKKETVTIAKKWG